MFVTSAVGQAVHAAVFVVKMEGRGRTDVKAGSEGSHNRSLRWMGK